MERVAVLFARRRRNKYPASVEVHCELGRKEAATEAECSVECSMRAVCSRAMWSAACSLRRAV